MNFWHLIKNSRKFSHQKLSVLLLNSCFNLKFNKPRITLEKFVTIHMKPLTPTSTNKCTAISGETSRTLIHLEDWTTSIWRCASKETITWMRRRKVPQPKKRKTWLRKRENSPIMKDSPKKLITESAAKSTNMERKRTSIGISTLSAKKKCNFLL